MGYEEQLSAAKFRAERDLARQECERLRARLRDSVPRAAYERKRAAWLRQIRECETALHRRRECIKRLENAALERRTVREEDREAAEWVRGQGGIEVLRRMFQDADSRRVELCGALNIDLDEGWSDAMDAMRPRLMPEGCKWPRYESGGQVQFGDVGLDVYGKRRMVKGVKFTQGGFAFISDDKGRTWWANDRGPLEDPEIDPDKSVNHPAPKVRDADGVEIREGDTVYRVDMSTFDPEYNTLTVTDIRTKPGLTPIETKNSHDGYSYGKPEDFTHRAPVLAADGKTLREGETVWEVVTGDGYVVERIYSGTTEPDFPGHTVACRRPGDIVTHMFKPSQLTHERPVPDADGKNLLRGETVYNVVDGEECRVLGFSDCTLDVNVMGEDGSFKAVCHDVLTHTKPEIDTWERLEEDATIAPVSYCVDRCLPCCEVRQGDPEPDLADFTEAMALDIVRRARALAGVE